MITAADRCFLETSLHDLAAPDSAIHDPGIALAVHAALRGEVSVMVAAEALLSGIRTACIERVMRGLEDDTGAETTPLESVADRSLREMAALPQSIQEFLRLHPVADWKVTEVVTREEPTRTRWIRGFDGRLCNGAPLNLLGVDHLYGKKEVFDWMHPRGSRLVRHLPFSFLLWDEAYRSGEGCVAVQLMARRCSLEELRNLLALRTRPVLLQIPRQPVGAARTYGSSILHDGVYDELKAFTHDIYHLRRWNEIPPDSRWPLQRTIGTLYGALAEAIQLQSTDVRTDPAVAEACDELLSGPTFYPALPDPYRVMFGSMDVYLRRLPADRYRKLWAEFGRRLRRELGAHLDAGSILAALSVAEARHEATSSRADPG